MWRFKQCMLVSRAMLFLFSTHAPFHAPLPGVSKNAKRNELGSWKGDKLEKRRPMAEKPSGPWTGSGVMGFENLHFLIWWPLPVVLHCRTSPYLRGAGGAASTVKRRRGRDRARCERSDSSRALSAPMGLRTLLGRQSLGGASYCN